MLPSKSSKKSEIKQKYRKTMFKYFSKSSKKFICTEDKLNHMKSLLQADEETYINPNPVWYHRFRAKTCCEYKWKLG